MNPLDQIDKDDRTKDLEYLNHVVRNNSQVVLGLIKEILNRMASTSEAILAFSNKWCRDDSDLRDNKDGRK